MTLFTIFLPSLPASYFNAALFAGFLYILRTHGPIFSPVKAVRIVWPFLRGPFGTLAPFLIAGNIILIAGPHLLWLALAVMSVGIGLGGLLAHRWVRSQVERPGAWDRGIAIAAVLQIVMLGTAFLAAWQGAA